VPHATTSHAHQQEGRPWLSSLVRGREGTGEREGRKGPRPRKRDGGGSARLRERKGVERERGVMFVLREEGARASVNMSFYS
jgi:hypothetical protein